MNWNSLRSIAVAIACVTPATACDDEAVGSGTDDADGKGDQPELPDGEPDGGALRTGRWIGRAVVPGGDFTRAGSFDARLVLYVGGDRVRGYLDVEQTEAGSGRVDSPSYFVDGEVAGDTVSLRFTDRVCGAAEPVGLCYPDGSGRRLIYQANAALVGNQLSFEPAEVIAGTTPLPGGLAFELPFEELELAYAEEPENGAGGPITGRWLGDCHLPRDVVYSLDLPMQGDNEMEIAAGDDGAPTITRFVNRGFEMWPADESILLGDTFRYDAAERRFWFVSLWSAYGRWLYMGRHDGDLLEILLVGDEIDPALAIWGEDRAPVDPLTADQLHSEGVCRFRRAR